MALDQSWTSSSTTLLPPQRRDLLSRHQLGRQHPRHRRRCPLGHDGTGGLLHHWLYHRLRWLCDRHRPWYHRVVRWGRRIGWPRPTRHGRVHLLHGRHTDRAHRRRRPRHRAVSDLAGVQQDPFKFGTSKTEEGAMPRDATAYNLQNRS